MALTKLTDIQPLHVHSIGISTFDGSVSVGGTLTYEDVTNVDAIGIVTARTGIKVLAGGINAVGVVTATQFKGDGSQLTGISGGISNIVEDTSPQLGGDLQSNGKDIDIADSDKINFGTGNDYQIFHDGGNSIQFFDAQVGDVRFRTDRGNTTRTNLNLGVGVDLYHSNTKRFETVNGGVLVTGNVEATGHLDLSDSGIVKLGTDDDLEVYHQGINAQFDNSTGNLEIRNKGTFSSARNIFIRARVDRSSINCVSDAQVELYFNNSKKLETVNGGVYVYGDLLFGVGTTGNLFGGDNDKVILGSGNDLQIFHESSSNDNVIDCATTRPLRIRMGGSNHFEFQTNGSIKMNDGRKIILGDSSDLQIEHNGTLSKILHNGTGDLIIHSQTSSLYLQHKHFTSIKTTDNGPEIGDTRHLRWASGNRYWTGEYDNKIQYHANNMYNQYSTHWIARNSSGTNTFTVDSSGNFSSDIRKKENITTVTDALTKVSQLRGVEFKWKEKYGNKEDMGLIAQEVETVLPKLIKDSPDPIGAAKENEDGTPMKMMNYNGLFSVMVEAIKDLKTKVETLETKVATLEGS